MTTKATASASVSRTVLVMVVRREDYESLHGPSRRTTITKTVRETEAEAVAFADNHKAIGQSQTSADYISLYHGNAELLMESLQIVQQTASVILAAIQPEEAVSQEVPESQFPSTETAQNAA